LRVARAIGITAEIGLVMIAPHRLALHDGRSREVLAARLEADKPSLVANPRNMHIAQRKRRITAAGVKDKTAVMAFLSAAVR